MFRFEEPAYLYLLLLLPLLIALHYYGVYRRKKAIRTFGDPDLVANLMPTISKIRPGIKFWILFVAIGLFSVLLARPQFGTKLDTVEKKGIEVMIVLDISNSMLAEDITPSRLDKSKLLISRLVDELHDDKVGLILFAGDAFTQLPITSDFISAKMFLPSISPNIIAKQGTNTAAAVDLAIRSFTSQEGVGRTIILITDGEDHEEGSIDVVKRATAQGIQVNVMGVGTTDGAPIPVRPGSNDFRKDREGNVVITRLNEEKAQQLAQAGQGIYVRVDNTNAAQRAITKEINTLTKTSLESKVYKEYDEQFHVFAWLIFMLLIVEILIINKQNPLFKNLNKLFK